MLWCLNAIYLNEQLIHTNEEIKIRLEAVTPDLQPCHLQPEATILGPKSMFDPEI